jgi:2-polyprenyl-3-methyl-5-hydroxy-6-metoxy-1,4-benzoquinol methylase
MSDYTKDDFMDDLFSNKIQHTKSLDRFSGFYHELGKLKVQHEQKYQAYRTDWIKPKGEVIELGCHVGFNVIKWARDGFNVTGVDISKSLLDQAKDRVRRQPREVRCRIKWIKSFIESLPVDKKYDTIVVTETLEHVINPLTILEKARDLLAKNGKIYVTSPNVKTGNNSHVRGVSSYYMRELAHKSGLKITKWQNIPRMTACVLEYDNK